MKFIDARGREHSVDIRPSRWERRAVGEGRGKFQSEVGNILSELFPGDVICEEFPCSGENLTLDFFVPRKKIAVEVQGRQHHQYVEFFHGDKAGFERQQKRDGRKHNWCELNNIRLVKIDTGQSRENVIKLLLDS
ncbi:MAG: hypothetical protein ACXABY_02210 [Candidatus Thorarchaeota archaeon]|jgi:hypothetical protein